MAQENLINYRSSQIPEFFIRDATEQDDSRLLELISETMPSNGMILSYERKPSYFAATRTQYTNPIIKLVCLVSDPDYIVAMINIGTKKCFINQQRTEMSYVADLRLDANYRGKRTVHFIMEYVYNTHPRDLFYQSVVLEGNLIARHLLHKPRENFPQPFPYDDVTTYMISKIKKPKSNRKISIKILEPSLITDVNKFIESMSQHYNFLPDYDFNELKQGNHPYWLGMKMEDFKLIYSDQNQLVGLFGLWNQKQFKQTKVKKYSKGLKLVKPFYNFVAKRTGQILLPPEEGHFNYLMIHSALCDPQHKDAFEQILYQAHLATKAKKYESFCITLAANDPRIQQMSKVKSHIIRAKHAIHSFESKPEGYFDRSKISYFEVGRI